MWHLQQVLRRHLTEGRRILSIVGHSGDTVPRMQHRCLLQPVSSVVRLSAGEVVSDGRDSFQIVFEFIYVVILLLQLADDIAEDVAEPLIAFLVVLLVVGQLVVQ